MADKKIRLLIVEDNPDLLDIMFMYLNSPDFEISKAANGFDAIKQLEKNAFDIVITDIIMPHMDGMQLLNHIKNNFPQTDVVVLTGFAEEYRYTDVLNAGAIDYIAKPFMKDEFHAKIYRVIRERNLVNKLNDELNQRKRMEEECRLHAEIMENLSEGICILGHNDGVFIYTNPIFEEMFGYNHGKMIGKHISIINTPTVKSPKLS